MYASHWHYLNNTVFEVKCCSNNHVIIVMCSKVLLAQEMYLRKIHTAGEEHCLPVQGRLHFELAVQKLISCFKFLEIGT